MIVPSVAIEPVGFGDVFDIAPGAPGDAVGGGWIGYLSYPDAAADGAGPRIPEAAGGWTDDVLRQSATEPGGTKAFPAIPRRHGWPMP